MQKTAKRSSSAISAASAATGPLSRATSANKAATLMPRDLAPDRAPAPREFDAPPAAIATRSGDEAGAARPAATGPPPEQKALYERQSRAR